MIEISNFFWTAEFWFFVGVIFIIAEILSVSFYFLFLGIGALITALLIKFGLIDALWAQFLTFAVVAVGSTLAFRGMALQLFGNNNSKGGYKEFIGDKAVISKAILPGATGKVTYRGTEWAAEALNGDISFSEGSPVVIKKVDGMTLIVG
jgi:inner membrane protein